jgi:transcriptional regulator with XRE-family HTH domain
MKQPELGKRLNEIRTQKGITQKELSDLCSVDIRTIQRIEAGEVEPRMSTIKILAAALENDELASNRNISDNKNEQMKSAYLVSFVAGFIFFFNFIVYTLIAPAFPSISGSWIYFLLSVTHVLTGGLFFFGFIILGQSSQNKLLLITSILIIILIPLFVIFDFLGKATGYLFFVYFIKIITVLMGINGILFGVGLLKVKNQLITIYVIAGVLQIVENMMFIIPVSIVQLAGLWLAVPANFILLLVIFNEFRKNKKVV